MNNGQCMVTWLNYRKWLIEANNWFNLKIGDFFYQFNSVVKNVGTAAVGYTKGNGINAVCGEGENRVLLGRSSRGCSRVSECP